MFLVWRLYSEKKTAKEEFREQQLKEEAEIRARLQQIQETLSLELEALGAAAIANRDFAHEQLPQLVSARESMISPVSCFLAEQRTFGYSASARAD